MEKQNGELRRRALRKRERGREKYRERESGGVDGDGGRAEKQSESGGVT